MPMPYAYALLRPMPCAFAIRVCPMSMLCAYVPAYALCPCHIPMSMLCAYALCKPYAYALCLWGYRHRHSA